MSIIRTVRAAYHSLLAAAILCLVSFAQVAESTDNWPIKGWRHTTPESQGMRSKALVDLLAEIREKKHRINSVTVVRDGSIVMDVYVHPFLKGLKHIIHSNTKSIMSTLIGIALDRAEIESVHQPVLDLFPNTFVANTDRRKRIMTLKHLLTMTSGFNCQDSYLHRYVGLTAMRRSPDWAQHVLDLPMIAEPGQAFEYCNGVTFLLSAILQNVTGMTALDYAKKHLFQPLGISDVAWPSTPMGVTIGYGEMWLLPTDMAKFGWLFLNGGKWANRQIVSKAWVENATRRQTDGTLFDHYGYQWWLDVGGYYMAVGFQGQFIFVVPDKNIVAVFTGNLKAEEFFVPRDLLVKFIIPSAVSDAALPKDNAQRARLDALIEQLATGPAEGFVWLRPEDGIARDGVFVRRTTPAFQFRYPLGSRKKTLNAPTQVMRMETIALTPFTANIAEIQQGAVLADAGPKAFVSMLRQSPTRNIIVHSNKKIELSDGTPAYRTHLTWRIGTLDLTTFVVSSFTHGKWVFLAAHPWRNHEDASNIVGSLSFDVEK